MTNILVNLGYTVKRFHFHQTTALASDQASLNQTVHVPLSIFEGPMVSHAQTVKFLQYCTCTCAKMWTIMLQVVNKE